MKKILTLIICIVLVSCKSIPRKDNELKQIELEEIFKMNYNKYIVLFYSSSCEACTLTLEVLNKRMKKEKYRGFCVNLNNEYINFSFDKKENIDKNKYEEIVFSSVPYLVYIDKKIIVKEVYGYNNIQKENLYIFFE